MKRLYTSSLAATLLLISCNQQTQGQTVKADWEIGDWVSCNGVVGTIEAPAEGDAGYVVQVWQPQMSQVTCAATALRSAADPSVSGAQDAPSPATPQPATPETNPAPAIPPAEQPAPAAKAGKVADGKYTCYKLMGGYDGYSSFGEYTIRDGQVQGDPLPKGWVILSVEPFDGPDFEVAIRYRAASGNEDLFECKRE